VVIKTDSAGYSGCNEVAVTTPFSSAAYLTPPPLSAFAGSVSNAGTWINSATASPGNANVLCTSVNSTGTQANEPVIIHPNPFINELFVDGISENSSGLFCEISDLAGRIVFSATIHAGNRIFTIPPIGSGIYLIKIYSGTTLVTKQKMMCMN
jgi:hypothetical protein